MKQTCVTRSTKLQGTQHSPELAFMRTDFCVPKNLIFQAKRLEFLEKFLAHKSALSDPEGNTSGPLNRVGIVDLPLLRILLAICQKS